MKFSSDHYFELGYNPTISELHKIVEKEWGEPLEYTEVVKLTKYALQKLRAKSELQYDHIRMHYMLSISIVDIAYNEGRSNYNVEVSIQRGIKNIQKYVRDKKLKGD